MLAIYNSNHSKQYYRPNLTIVGASVDQWLKRSPEAKSVSRLMLISGHYHRWGISGNIISDVNILINNNVLNASLNKKKQKKLTL